MTSDWELGNENVTEICHEPFHEPEIEVTSGRRSPNKANEKERLSSFSFPLGSEQSVIFVFQGSLCCGQSVYLKGGECEMEAIAKHEFHATADDELSFKKGSVIKVNESLKAYHIRHFSNISLREIVSLNTGICTAVGRFHQIMIEAC